MLNSAVVLTFWLECVRCSRSLRFSVSFSAPAPAAAWVWMSVWVPSFYSVELGKLMPCPLHLRTDNTQKLLEAVMSSDIVWMGFLFMNNTFTAPSSQSPRPRQTIWKINYIFLSVPPSTHTYTAQSPLQRLCFLERKFMFMVGSGKCFFLCLLFNVIF